MKNNFYKVIKEYLPIAYAYYKIICDKKGLPIDFEFLETNPAFEKLTGLKGTDIVGKKVAEVIPAIRNKEVDWVKNYWKILLKGEADNFDQFLNILNKCYSIDAFSPKKGYFITLFTDITEKTEIQNQLLEREENYLRFFNTIDDLVFIATVDGKTVFVNEAVITKLGYLPEEIFSMYILDFHPPEYRDDAENIFKEMIIGLKDFCPIPLIKKDGTRIPVETRVWSGKWGGKECIYGISKDLSIQQAALDKFQKLFDKNPSLMASSSISTGKFIDVNSAFLKKLGYSKDEVIGKTSDELKLFVSPKKLTRAAEKLKNKDTLKNFILKVKTKKGKIIDGLFAGEIIDNQLEKSFLTVMTDVTEVRNKQEALEKQSKFHKLLVESTANFINATAENLNEKIDLMLKECGKYYEVDRSYIFLFSNDYVFASNTNEWCAEGIAPQKENLQHIPMEYMPWWMEYLKKFENIYIHDVNKLPVEAAAEKDILQAQNIKSLIVLPIINNKKLLGFLGFDSVKIKRKWPEEQVSVLSVLSNIVSDVLIKCKMEVEMLKAKETAECGIIAKNQFLASMSHEFRTPLNGINGYLELLKTTMLTKEQSKYINKINVSIETLILLINDILDIAKMEAGKLVLKKTLFDIRYALHLVIDVFENKAMEKGVKLNFFVDPDIPKKLFGDQIRLKQVLSNIIENAIKFTDIGGIFIAIKVKNQTVNKIELIFSIKDSGAGMSDNFLKVIFEPFAQEMMPFVKVTGGVGLGLPICKNIIEIMGGNITIDSKAGKGTTVEFNLMLEKAEGRRLKEQKSDKVGEYLSLKSGDLQYDDIRQGLKILIAEDDEISGSFLTEILKKFGLISDWVFNGEDAVKACKKRNYDIVFMDCLMPVMNGFDATRQIRRMEAGKRHTIIIGVTAYAMKQEIDQILQAGMNDYLIKPIDINQLKAIIEKYGNAPKENENGE